MNGRTDESGVHEFPDDRRTAIRKYPRRWSNATVAAALTYPTGFRVGVRQWVDLLDLLDERITGAEIESSVARAGRR